MNLNLIENVQTIVFFFFLIIKNKISLINQELLNKEYFPGYTDYRVANLIYDPSYIHTDRQTKMLLYI